MGFQADTLYRQVGVGTSLHIMESPTVVGYPPTVMPGGIDLPIRNSDGTTQVARVLKADPAEAFIELGGIIWRMTPHTSADAPVMINSPGLHSKDWVIRDQVQSVP